MGIRSLRVSGAALDAFRQAGDTAFGEIYLAGHPDHPRILITECGELGSPKDIFELFGTYGKAFGSTLGALHSRDSSWFDTVEHLAGCPCEINDTAVGILFDSLLALSSEVQAELTQHTYTEAGTLPRDMRTFWMIDPKYGISGDPEVRAECGSNARL